MNRERLLETLHRGSPWGSTRQSTGIPREITNSLDPWLARWETLAICGARRSGKTTLMRQLAARLVERGKPANEILFVSFEDPVFLQTALDATILDLVFETYREEIRPTGIPTLFLDEIQNIEGWARWVRAKTDTRDVRVVVSGSSSRMLEPDVATVLTGRNHTVTLWPLSFAEFISFKGQEVPSGALTGLGPSLRPLLMEYLRFGGYPESALAESDSVREALLKQYFRDILYRDVVSRHQVRDIRALEQTASHLLVNTANLVTYNRLKNTYGLSMDQVRSYARYLDECYLVREVPRFAFKVSTQSRSPRKVHATDVGLRNAVAFRFSEDLGRLAETVVHGQLARNDDLSLFYHQGHHECDLIAWRGDRAVGAYQVCFEDTELPARETAGLVEACKALKLTEGTLITNRVDATETSDGVAVRMVPLWRWLLEAARADVA